jgi:2-polyprenyl-6-methoxyphenol hydroxylase-like FAD-dependent oxidoreductase
MANTSSADGARARVLVVGAGPVGLLAAIQLRDLGIVVRIIDEQPAESKRTYPVLLHPRTLRILSALGVTAPLEWRGRPVTRLAVHVDGERCAALKVPAAGAASPGAMTLPQDVLRLSLLQRLSELGVEVEWQTRLRAIEQDAARVSASLIRREPFEEDGPSLRIEWRDASAESLHVDFVVGADGVQSAVRGLLGIDWVPQGPRQMYAFFDVPDERASDEAQLVLASGTSNSVYPLQGARSRLTFQLSVGLGHAPGEAQLRQLLTSRLPWYGADVRSFEWSGSTEFSPALAQRFGEGRAWLAGDAAHSTGPLGAQSLNAGLHEARDLAHRIGEQLDATSVWRLGVRYAEQRRLEWQRLFGLGPSRPNVERSADWVKRHIAQLLSSLPASGDDLDDLLEQLRVTSA